MTADEALFLVLTGSVGVYWEFLRPGRVAPPVIGCMVASWGLHGFARLALSRSGLIYIGLALVFFLVEAFGRTDFVAGVGGTVLLSAGCCVLAPGPTGVSHAFAIPACAVFGGLTLFLCYAAKRARRNKWWDLDLAPPPYRSGKTELSANRTVE